MSNTCPECKTELKELLFSRYCPNEENHGTFKGIDKSYSAPTAGFQLSKNTWGLPQSAPKPWTAWHQQITLQVANWTHNAQRRLFYANAILYAPSLVIANTTVRSNDPDVLVYISGQHRANSGKKTEITLVAEAPTPRDAVLELEVYFP